MVERELADKKELSENVNVLPSSMQEVLGHLQLSSIKDPAEGNFITAQGKADTLRY